jgi:glucose-1-phosphate adenylyltransferase
MHFKTQNPTHYIILSGDQLYRMDLKEFFDKHVESGADITIATTTVNREDASGFGIMKINAKNRITEFMEKPALSLDIADWKIPEKARNPETPPEKEYLASMGIYIFNAAAMEEVLNNDMTDFGKQIIPMAIKDKKVNSYVYDGYWEDIGTIRNFYDSNLDLTNIAPKFNFYDEMKPIYTHSRNLPPSKMNKADIDQGITSEGCVITNAVIKNSIIGVRAVIESGTFCDGVIDMGADCYETDEQKADNAAKGIPNIGIGKNCQIKGAIIDKNARIGDNCSIGMGEIPADGEYPNYYVVDGIIVIPKNAVISSGSTF